MSRVLLVVGSATGGMGGHVAALARGLIDHGHQVKVFTSGTTAQRFEFAAEVLADWPDVRALRRLVAAADVVHAHGHQAGLLTVLVAATVRSRPPVVVTWHNAVLGGGLKRRVLGWAEQVQARRADLVTGASCDLVDRARALGARNPELSEVAGALGDPETMPRGAGDSNAPQRSDVGLSNSGGAPERDGDTPEGFDLPSPNADDAPDAGRAADAARRPTPPTVLTVSRIAPQKRLDVLIEAAALLAADHPAARWIVVGDGDPTRLAQLEARRDVLAAPVAFVGHRTDVPALMAAATVFALASDWEARALVVQEAMAAGLPVVATEVGGLPDLLGPAGLLVPPGDARALAAAVARVLADPVLAADLAAAGRERFRTLPTAQNVLEAWLLRYARLQPAFASLTHPE